MCDLCVRFMSHNKFGLWELGVTHVLNAAHGKICCKGNDDFYGTTVKYYGIPANDLPTFDLSPFFYPAAEFIHRALTSDGKPSHSFFQTWHWDNTSVSAFCLLWLFRKGVCALCCRCKSLSYAGAGLSDDSSPSQPPVLNTLCATETLDFSQQRLLKTTHQTGPKTSRVNRVKSSDC